MTRTKKILFIPFALCIAGATAWLALRTDVKTVVAPPRPIEPIQYPTDDPKIVVVSPLPSSTVSSPLMITGKAKGPWFFEASFPVELLDANGTTIARCAAQAEEDWMTENFVPFTASLVFRAPTAGSTGTLILRKDNPSGLPEYDDEVGIPVKF
jgi:hypothetical protein